MVHRAGFLIVLFVLRYAAMRSCTASRRSSTDNGVLRGGANMAVVHLSGCWARDVLMGIVSGGDLRAFSRS